MGYAAQEVLPVLAEDLEVAPRPAQALVPGLAEAGGLLVVEDGVVAVAYLEPAHDVVDGELNVLRQQVEIQPPQSPRTFCEKRKPVPETAQLVPSFMRAWFKNCDSRRNQSA